MYFYFWKIYYSTMFHISVLDFSLMSQGLITIEIIRISLLLIEIWWKMWWKSWKIRENTLLEKQFQSYIFNFFFFSSCHKEIPYEVSEVKKQKLYSMYVLYKIKKHIFTSKLFGYIKSFKTKSFENFPIIFSTVYRVRGVVVSRNFSPIGEYSS